MSFLCYHYFMLSEEKIVAFLKLQQIVLDIEESTQLLEQFLPIALQELKLVGYPYIFLSAIFVDDKGQIRQSFFIDHTEKKPAGKVTRGENFFQKGSEWEMKVMYGEAAVVSDAAYFINPAYPELQKIHSLLILPIQHIRKLAGVLVLASPTLPEDVNSEEIEFGEMVTRLIDLAFRLQDTESSLITINQQVYEMNAKLHQLDKLKDDFVSLTSHELRTPMAAIRSYAWMALHRSDVPISPNVEKYLARILISTERLINLVNDMLNISRIESGRIEIKPEPVDLNSLCKDIIDEVYYSKSTDKNINFTLLEEPTPKVFADPEKLRQVLLNIMGNALKFSPKGGRITIGFFTDGVTIEIYIKDEGPGISSEDLSKLFKKFGRLDNSYTAAATSGGTGLGLYISKSLIELMHGKIWASSEGTGKGSTFAFSLPAATEEVIANTEKYAVKAKGEVKGLEPAAI